MKMTTHIILQCSFNFKIGGMQHGPGRGAVRKNPKNLTDYERSLLKLSMHISNHFILNFSFCLNV